MKPDYRFALAVFLAIASASGVCADSARSSSSTERPGQAKTEKSEASAKHEIYGTIRAIKEYRITLETRAGKTIQVDAEPAVRGARSVSLAVGRAIDVVGILDKAGVLHAETIQHAKPSPAVWPPDR